MKMVNESLVQVFRDLVAGKERWPLFLHGPVGTGKTSAALCLADWCDTATIVTPDRLCDITKRDNAETEWDFIARKELAILDELGTRTVNEFHYSVVKRFLDEREEHAGRVGIYISNIKPSDVSTLYDDRIASRLLCGTRVELSGKDRRVAR